MSRRVSCAWVVAAALSMAGCLSPTDPSDVIGFGDAVDVSASPDPIAAQEATDGRTYRIVRGNNQPDDILLYDWHAVFTVTVTFNENARHDDVNLEFPVRMTAVTLTVKQASGGIVTPPTGSDTEHYEFVTLSSSGNQLSDVGVPLTLVFEVWYDLPSLRKEAVVTVSYTFVDDDGVTFQKSEDLQVAP